MWCKIISEKKTLTIVQLETFIVINTIFSLYYNITTYVSQRLYLFNLFINNKINLIY